MLRTLVSLWSAILLASCLTAVAEPSANLLKNPSFEGGWQSDGAPTGWRKYGARKGGATVSLGVSKAASDGDAAVVLNDSDASQEIGVYQRVKATGGLYYRATVQVRALEGATASGAYIQMRFAPSSKFEQAGFSGVDSKEFKRIAVQGEAPKGTTSITIYLYTHKSSMPRVIVDSAELVSSAEKFAAPARPWPEMVPPQYKKIKELYLDTALVRGGMPQAAIVAPKSGDYDADAKRIAEAIRAKTGVSAPIVADDSPEAALPPKAHLIVLGNRSTNALISELYNRYFTLLDLRYPGAGGSVVRTLHNPFGKGINVVFAGGSDAEGVAKAASQLVRRISDAKGGKGELVLGRLMDIELGKGVALPQKPDAILTWEDSHSYKNKGYFGWNSISKHLAAYYMTGDEGHARQAIRLAFPDADAKRQITEIDEERIENKDDPLAGSYHYNCHMMILYWDLVEESPVFSDAERLRVTNAFARQVAHPDGARAGAYKRAGVHPSVGSRHGQWAAISNYTLGRYFSRDYADPIWKHMLRSGGELYFGCLNQYAWVTGEKDNLWWYSTSVAPVLSYLLLSGERRPVENGVLRHLMLGQEILVSGRPSEYYLRCASLGFLRKAAYLLDDGRYLDYVKKAGLDPTLCRVGQSYEPAPDLRPAQPENLVGKWSIRRLAKPEWQQRRNGFPFEESFHFASYRSALKGEGDYIALDGFNGASRNPYHTFAILALRLDGTRLLDGVLNQVTTRLDGMVEPQVAMNAALRRHDVLGDMVCAVGEVPDAAYCNWRRSLIQRVGRYALVADELTFETDGDNAQVEIKWSMATGARSSSPAAGTLAVAKSRGGDPTFIRACGAKYRTNLKTPRATGELGSYDVVLLRAREPGAWLELPFTLARSIDSNMQVEFLGFVDRGVVQVYLDGKAVGGELDINRPSAQTVLLDMGRQSLAAGEHVLRVEVVGKHPGVSSCLVALSGIRVDRPEGQRAQISRIDIACCDALPVKGGGTMEWVGAVKKGVPRRWFSLIAPTTANAKRESVCSRLSDSAAVLALPEPAVVVAGEWQGTRADLAIVAMDHLYGLRVSEASLAGKPILKSSKPLDVAWEFGAGRLDVVAHEDAQVVLAVDGESVQVDGKRAGRKGSEGVLVDLAKGRHAIESARASVPVDAAERLKPLLAEARQERATGGERMARPVSYDAPKIAASILTRLPGSVGNLVAFPDSSGAPLIAAVVGKSIHVIDAKGEVVRTLQADATIRMAHWWPEPQLLLAGCTDEKVIAFDREGNRRWVFVSEMDPAVFRAAKQYWFKSAPGHNGIHGLFSGKFIDGKEQAFVGSACTLEIVNTDGRLVKRMPLFWGKNSTFAMLDRSNGERSLLVSRRYSGSNRVNIIGPKTLNPSRYGYSGTPPGHTMVSGWAAMNRLHLFTEDLNGDGKPEVMSEVNGVWNRVTVWSEDDRPLYNASFGPGAKIPARNLRDIDVGDLDGDGDKEIVVATWLGLVVGLDDRCDRLWSVRCDPPPRTVACVGRRVVVGCDDGKVLVVDARGRVLAQGMVDGSADHILDLSRHGKSRVAFGTAKGDVAVFDLKE